MEVRGAFLWKQRQSKSGFIGTQKAVWVCLLVVRTGDWVWSLSQGFMDFKSVKGENISDSGNLTSGEGKEKGTSIGEDKIKTEKKKRF